MATPQQSLADVVDILERRQNKDLMISTRLSGFSDDVRSEVLTPILDFRKRLFQRLTWMNESLFRIEKSLVRLITMQKEDMRLRAMAEGVQKLKDSEEPEAQNDPVKKPSKKPTDLSKFDLVDLLAAAGIGFLAFKTRIAEGVSSLIQMTVDTFLTWVKGIRPFILKLFDSKLVQSVKKITTDFKKTIGPFFKRMGDFFKLVGSRIADAVKLVPGVAQVSEWAARLLRVVRFIAWPITIGFSMWEAIKTGKEDIEALESDATQLDKVIAGIAGGFKGILKFIVGGILDIVKGVTSWVIEFFAGEGNRVSTFLDSFSFEDIIGSMVDSVRNFVLSQIEGIRNIISAYKSDGIGAALKAVLDQILNNVMRIFQPIVQLLVGLVNRIPLVDIPEGLHETIKSFGVDPKTGANTGSLDPEVVGGQGGIESPTDSISDKVSSTASSVSDRVAEKAENVVVDFGEARKKRVEYFEKKNVYLDMLREGGDPVKINEAGETLIITANRLAYQDKVINPAEAMHVERIVKQNAPAITKIKTESKPMPITKSNKNSREQLTQEIQRSIIERDMNEAAAGGKGGNSLMISAPNSNTSVTNNNTNIGTIPMTSSDPADPAGVTYRSAFTGR